MAVADAIRDRVHRALRHHRLVHPENFLRVLRDARALEIGGPSAVFSSKGALPAYSLCRSVDATQWSSNTHWHGSQRQGDYSPDGRVLGRMHLLDGTNLTGISDGSYDVVLASHVIEHIANPLKALHEWQRVLAPGGHLIVIAPHKEGTFDHRRPVTPIAHMIDDFERGVEEDDLTHLDETLALHDRSRDADSSSDDEFAASRRDNLNHRLLHHHVFVTKTLIELLGTAGFEVDAAQARWPHDIYALAERPLARSRSSNNLPTSSEWSSPFRADR